MIFERKLCIEKFEIENIYQTEGMAGSNSWKERKTFIIYLDLDAMKEMFIFHLFQVRKVSN